MTDKKEKIIIDGKECRYWFRPNPSDYRRCALRGKDDNCDEINDCFIKELLGKLARKEQECNKLYIQLKADEEYHKEEENTLRKIIKNKEERNIELYKENNQLKVNNEKMSKGYAELTEIVRPYIEDFTGYNEKLGGFDIVLCVKEFLEQFKHLQTENEKN